MFLLTVLTVFSTVVRLTSSWDRELSVAFSDCCRSVVDV